MSARRDFLLALFASLEAKAVPFCVLRNYENIYEDESSDVDLAAESEDVPRLEECLTQAAAAIGYCLIHRALYVNYSYVYRHVSGVLVRIDVETEIRWRIFPVLSAKAVIGLRRKRDEFHIPHPRHESVSLLCQAIWRRHLPEKYRIQLGSLYQQLNGSPEPLSASPSSPSLPPTSVAAEQLAQTFRATFGSAGDELARCQARMLQEQAPPELWRIARNSLIRNAFADGPTRHEFFSYLLRDLRRLARRIRQPAGISLLYVSDAENPAALTQLVHQIEFLYPAGKSSTVACVVSTDQFRSTRLTLATRWRRLLTLFKGGLFLRSFRVAADTLISRVVSDHTRYLYPDRAFICVQTLRFGTYLAHRETGFMEEVQSARQNTAAEIIEFIARILEPRARPAQIRRRGALLVLVGLDGSGKTTVARKLCCLQGMQGENPAFQRIRYFHWQPRLRQTIFPLPAFAETPRKVRLKRSFSQSVLSVARLLKNLFLTQVTYWLRLAPLLRSGSLIMIDRYYYNYFLDPVSVKYYGPRWALDWAQKCFPRPDLVVVLKAPSDVLLQRKRELSPEEITQQNSLLQLLNFRAARVVELDASQAPDHVAAQILAALNAVS